MRERGGGVRRDLTQLFKPTVAMVSPALYGQRSQRAALLGTQKRMWCFAPERSVTSGVLQRTANMHTGRQTCKYLERTCRR